MNTLPADVKLYDIALDLNLNDLRHLCTTNRNMRNICNDDNFWRQKTLRDFGDISDINRDPWRSIYIREYQRRGEERCVQEQLDFNRRTTQGLLSSLYDIIILNKRLATLMGIKHLPIVTGSQTVGKFLDAYLVPLGGPIYTRELFRAWWYNYIEDHGLIENKRVYPDQLMRDVFKISIPPRQKVATFFTAQKFSIPLAQFDVMLDNTISDLTPDNLIDLDPDMARALCAERKRLTGKW